MNYQEKYIKYKIKNLKSQYGGFIKGVPSILKEYTNENFLEFKSELDIYMPLCSFDNDKSNIILINSDNYILINKKLNEEYELYQLDNIFDIKKIDKPHEMIDNNIVIPGINKMVNNIHLIQAYMYNNENIFRNFFSHVWTTAYPYFNRLKDIVYLKFKGQILYQKNINIVLSIIFMNKLNDIISILNNLNIKDDINNYHKFESKSKNKVFNDIKTRILFDYVNAYDYLMVDELKKIDTFDKLLASLNNTFSNIEILHFNEQPQIDEFNLIIKIIKVIYKYIDENPNLIDQYNYSIFILKYKNFNDIIDEKVKNTNYKSLKAFINKYDRNTIKNKLVLNISCLIYLCYKTNIELGINYRTAEYMLIDYFLGIIKVKNSCIPINERHVLLKLLNLNESILKDSKPIKDELEDLFYKKLSQNYKEIKQYTFYTEIRYTDCGETTILNIFNYLLLKDDGTFDLSDADSWDIKLKEFYSKYPTMNSMTDTPVNILKTDLAIVFNNRDDDQIIYNNKEAKCDIYTTMENIIKTCSTLLKIETDNFIDIFKKLNKSVNPEDIIVSYGLNLKYSDKFVVNMNDGHAEFKLLNNFKINIGSITDDNNLFHHWINTTIWTDVDEHDYKKLPDKYSLEHFKFYYYSDPYFFQNNISDDQQTDAICIEAVKIPNIIDNISKYKLMAAVNFKNCKNKTEELCKIAIDNDLTYIEDIPHVYQNKLMIDKLNIKFHKKYDGSSEGYKKMIIDSYKRQLESIRPDLLEFVDPLIVNS
jgi:hypothetical protein